MKGCKSFRHIFAEYLFDEIDGESNRKFESHLARCPNCSSQLTKMKQTLEMMGQKRRVEPPEEFWASYWARLRARMEQEAAPKARAKIGLWEKIQDFFPSIPGSAYRWAAVVGALVMGILIGRFFFSSFGVKEPTVAERAHLPEEAPLAQTVDERAERYLEKSKIFLIGFVNTDPEAEGGEILVPRQREISEELIQEASFLKENLKGHPRQGIRALIEDLEAVLIEIANLEEQEDLPHIELIRSGIDRKGILLKINIHQMRGGHLRI
ncbi:MAG: zf-HC2 domain-containing protein [bacterium]